MKLTEEESQIVADNHDLIYWYLHLAHLNLEDWYGLIATELCYSVQKYNPAKGKLSTYFKLRADTLVYKQYRKSMAQKRFHLDIQYIDEYSITPKDECNKSVIQPDNLYVQHLFSGKDGHVLKLKYEGYTQSEIAKQVGCSQSNVSVILKGIREKYNRDR